MNINIPASGIFFGGKSKHFIKFHYNNDDDNPFLFAIYDLYYVLCSLFDVEVLLSLQQSANILVFLKKHPFSVGQASKYIPS